MTDRGPDSVKNRQISGHTDKDGTGDELRLVVDANGYLKVVLQANADVEIGNVQISDQSKQAGIQTLSSFADDLDGLNGLITAAALFGRASSSELLPLSLVKTQQDGLSMTYALAVHASLCGLASDGGFDRPHVSGEALHVKRGHADSVRGTVQTTDMANSSFAELRAAATISSTLDAYLTSVTLFLRDAAAFLNAAGESFLVIFCVGATTTTDYYFIGKLSNERDGASCYDGTAYMHGRTWNLPTPERIPANTNLRIAVVNLSGNELDYVRVTWTYYLE